MEPDPFASNEVDTEYKNGMVSLEDNDIRFSFYGRGAVQPDLIAQPPITNCLLRGQNRESAEDQADVNIDIGCADLRDRGAGSLREVDVDLEDLILLDQHRRSDLVNVFRTLALLEQSGVGDVRASTESGGGEDIHSRARGAEPEGLLDVEVGLLTERDIENSLTG